MFARWYAFAIAAVIGIAIGLFMLISAKGTAAQVSQAVTDQPFTISMAYYGTPGDGIVTPPQTKLFARNSAGSTVEVRAPFPGVKSGIRIITNRDSRIVIDVITESKTTYKQSSTLQEGTCVHSDQRDEIFGIEVFKTDTTMTLNAPRSIRLERWIAPKLACFTLREVRTQFENGTVKSRNMAEIISLVLAEPTAELFAIPESYVERAPSQVLAEVARRRPDICTNCASNPELSDQAYFNKQ